jgi:Phosphatidylethanolamine-binding protein
VQKKLYVALGAAFALAALIPVTAAAKHDSPGHDIRLQVGGLIHGRFGPNQVYDKLGCVGGNMSPELLISGVPKAAKSLAITIFDPDAPTQSGWWHWLVYDLPPGTARLKEDASKTGLPSDAQTPSFAGTERFRFRLQRLRGRLPTCRKSSTPLPRYRLGGEGGLSRLTRRAARRIRCLDRLPHSDQRHSASDRNRALQPLALIV